MSVRVAVEGGVDEDWLNDGVKGYLSERGSFSEHLELSNLKVFCADANYLFAMKCVAMRIGEEFQDHQQHRLLAFFTARWSRTLTGRRHRDPL